MDNSFFSHLQLLELMAFFSGYPLVYAVIISIAGKKPEKNSFGESAASMLPFAYALVGTLFLGFQLKKLYPDYSFEHIKLTMQVPLLTLWGLLSILFWIPAIGKKKYVSLIHSLVFFFVLVKDIVMQLSASSTDNDIVKNDKNIYTHSLALNFGAFLVMLLISFLYTRYKKSTTS
jgi:hypothetical protein